MSNTLNGCQLTPNGVYTHHIGDMRLKSRLGICEVEKADLL